METTNVLKLIEWIAAGVSGLTAATLGSIALKYRREIITAEKRRAATKLRRRQHTEGRPVEKDTNVLVGSGHP